MASWHAFSPRTALATLAVAAVVVDWFRLGEGMESVGYLNLAIVWLIAQQLGFRYADGNLAGLTRRTLWGTEVGAFATLAGLTTWGPYPVSMVGIPGETSNMTPPTICLLVLAMAMTVYLWHLSVLVLAFFALFGLGFDPPTAGSGLWWLTRPLWLLVLAAALLVIATWLSPLERGRTTRPSTARQSAVATTGSGMGAALISFGLLGYVASGLQPAAHGSSMLLFVPVDPLQNTICVLAGLAVSASLRERSTQAEARNGGRLHPGERRAWTPRLIGG